MSKINTNSTIKKKQTWQLNFLADGRKSGKPKFGNARLLDGKDRLFVFGNPLLPKEIVEYCNLDENGYLQDFGTMEELESAGKENASVRWNEINRKNGLIDTMGGTVEIDVAAPNPDYASFSEELAEYGLKLDANGQVVESEYIEPWIIGEDGTPRENQDCPSSDENREFLLTDPYHHISWSVGNSDDFVCFDYAFFCDFRYCAIDSTVNSETGGFIQTFQYEIVPAEDAVRVMRDIADSAFDWCGENEVRFNRRESERSVQRLLKEMQERLDSSTQEQAK